MRGKHPNNKNIGSPGLFSCKSLHEFNNFHARYRVVQNLDFIWLAFTHAPFWLPLTYVPKYTCAMRALIVGVFSKSASQVFTDNVVDLVSSVAVGLTFKDSLTMFRLVCHVLSTNRSCQMKGLKSRTEHLSAWIAYHTDPLECKLTYGWMSITEIFFALLKVSGNHQSLARKVAVSKFNWVVWSCESLLGCL